MIIADVDSKPSSIDQAGSNALGSNLDPKPPVIVVFTRGTSNRTGRYLRPTDVTFVAA